MSTGYLDHIGYVDVVMGFCNETNPPYPIGNPEITYSTADFLVSAWWW